MLTSHVRGRRKRLFLCSVTCYNVDRLRSLSLSPRTESLVKKMKYNFSLVSQSPVCRQKVRTAFMKHISVSYLNYVRSFILSVLSVKQYYSTEELQVNQHLLCIEYFISCLEILYLMMHSNKSFSSFKYCYFLHIPNNILFLSREVGLFQVGTHRTLSILVNKT